MVSAIDTRIFTWMISAPNPEMSSWTFHAGSLKRADMPVLVTFGTRLRPLSSSPGKLVTQSTANAGQPVALRCTAIVNACAA
jgi:hypothetical protein